MSASRNEANARRDAGSVAPRRSISFPQGTRVTYVTLYVPLQELELLGTLRERDVHATRLSNPCFVWKITARVRERGARSG